MLYSGVRFGAVRESLFISFVALRCGRFAGYYRFQ